MQRCSRLPPRTLRADWESNARLELLVDLRAEIAATEVRAERRPLRRQRIAGPSQAASTSEAAPDAVFVRRALPTPTRCQRLLGAARAHLASVPTGPLALAPASPEVAPEF